MSQLFSLQNNILSPKRNAIEFRLAFNYKRLFSCNIMFHSCLSQRIQFNWLDFEYNIMLISWSRESDCEIDIWVVNENENVRPSERASTNAWRNQIKSKCFGKNSGKRSWVGRKNDVIIIAGMNECELHAFIIIYSCSRLLKPN